MAETPSRYCSNCGQELPDAGQFCPNCGSPVHRTAHVPTPEADVPVQPPPQAGNTSAATPGQPARRGFGRRHPILTGCLGIIVLIFLLGILGVALGGGGDETAGGGGNGGQQAQEEDAAQPEQQNENQGQNAGQGQEQGPARMGEEVVVGDVAYTVTNARQETVLEDPSGFDEPLEGNFIIVDFTVENRGGDPISVSDVGLYVYDSQDREFETESEVPLGYIPEDRDLFLMDRLNPGLSQNVRTVFTVPPDAQGFEMEVSSGLFGAETRRIDLGF